MNEMFGCDKTIFKTKYSCAHTVKMLQNYKIEGQVSESYHRRVASLLLWGKIILLLLIFRDKLKLQENEETTGPTSQNKCDGGRRPNFKNLAHKNS